MVLNQLRSESLFTGEFVWARKESSHQRRIHAKAVEKSPSTPRASQLLSHHCDDEKRQVVVPRKPKIYVIFRSIHTFWTLPKTSGV